MRSMQFEINWAGKYYDVLASVHTYVEQYGADADGNRGVDRRVWELESLMILDEGRDVTELIESQAYNLIEEEIQKEMEE